MRPSYSVIDQLWESDDNRLRVSISNSNHSVTSHSPIRSLEKEIWIQWGLVLLWISCCLIVSLFLSLTCKWCRHCLAHEHILPAAIACCWVNYIPHTVYVILWNSSCVCLTWTVNNFASWRLKVIHEGWVCSVEGRKQVCV